MSPKYIIDNIEHFRRLSVTAGLRGLVDLQFQESGISLHCNILDECVQCRLCERLNNLIKGMLLREKKRRIRTY